MANRYLIRTSGITISIIGLCASAEGQMVSPNIGGPPPPLVMQFAPNPPSPNVPEFLWTGPVGNLQTGPGCIGNGDGDLPLSAQTPGGLEVDTGVAVPNIPNSTIDATGTHFYDVTLQLSSDMLPTDLAAVANSGVMAGGIAVQPLTSGSFSLYTTPANDSPAQQAIGPIRLLSGTLTNNSLSVGYLGNDTSATFQSASVALTGGAILNALNGGNPIPVSWSIALTTASPINVHVGAEVFPGISLATIDTFTADATSLIPEPGGNGIAAIAAIGYLAHSRRRSRRRYG